MNMTMKKKALVTALAVSLATPAVQAGPKHHATKDYKSHKEYQQTKHRPRTHERYEYARVLRAKPIYRTVQNQVPRQRCWQETVTHYDQPYYGNNYYYDHSYDSGSRGSSSATGTILGGLVGAAIGNEVGHSKRNKQVGAVAGALLGASIGNDLTRDKSKKHKHNKHNRYNGPRYEQVERCETVYDTQSEERVVGYRVKYRYNGETYRTRMDYHPGDQIKVRVSITPVI